MDTERGNVLGNGSKKRCGAHSDIPAGWRDATIRTYRIEQRGNKPQSRYNGVGRVPSGNVRRQVQGVVRGRQKSRRKVGRAMAGRRTR